MISEIPEDCLMTIMSFIEVFKVISVYFVSKKWRRIYCGLANRKIAVDLKLPLALAASVRGPKSYTSRTQSQNVLALREKYFKNVVYPDMYVREGTLDPGTDGEISSTDAFSSFFWFGANGRYIDALCDSNDFYDTDEQQSYHEFEYDLQMKDLTSDTEKNLYISKEFEYRDKSHPWDDEKVAKISKWLGIDEKIELRKFGKLFPVFVPKHRSYSSSARYIFQSRDFAEAPEWSGKIALELDKILRIFLDDKQGWANEMEFVTNRIKVKLMLMKRIRKSSHFAGENKDATKKELLSLIEHAKMKLGYFQRVTLVRVNSVDIVENYILTFDQGPKDFASLCVCLSADSDLVELNLKASDSLMKSCYEDDDFPKHLQVLIDELQLKHVTVADLTNFVAALTQQNNK